MIAPPMTHPLFPRRSPILTRSRSAMAQFVSEPLLTLVTEGVSASAPLVAPLAPFVPLVTLGFPPDAFGIPVRPRALADIYPSGSGRRIHLGDRHSRSGDAFDPSIPGIHHP